ncbi:MAG TPA: hypothetical protein VHD90_27625 [Phototrophicaceae bacterium]|nr:hypothetical protein [Phototrophicaceae bacterium]
MTNSMILYIGGQETGQALAALVERDGGCVHLPENLMQALGMYITYFPEIVVIDLRVDYAEAAFKHLRSVDASPLLVLTDQRIHEASIYTIPTDASPEALALALDHLQRELSAPHDVSNGVLHYA